MNNESMADFICEMRKAKNLTQKQLAEQLNITDKAISKWERGMGYPDITMLVPLAEILGVTTNELLNGRKAENTSVTDETPVKAALQYAEKVKKTHSSKAKNIINLILNISFVIAAFVCIICDLAITGSLSWSLYPLASIAYAWLIIEPLFYFKKSKIKISLAALSIFIFPFLFCIQQISNTSGWLLPLAFPIALTGIIGFWLIYLLYTKIKNKWFATSLCLIIILSITVITNGIANLFTNQPVIGFSELLSTVSIVAASLILFIIGCVFNKK